MKKIMVRAWEIYRTLEGDRLAKLAMALRQAWAEAKQQNDDAYNAAYEAHRPRVFGQITRFEAGVIYKAMKQGLVNITKQAVSRLYNECDKMFMYASERYDQNHVYYDAVNLTVGAILTGNYGLAQKQIARFENA